MLFVCCQLVGRLVFWLYCCITNYTKTEQFILLPSFSGFCVLPGLGWVVHTEIFTEGQLEGQGDTLRGWQLAVAVGSGDGSTSLRPPV